MKRGKRLHLLFCDPQIKMILYYQEFKRCVDGNKADCLTYFLKPFGQFSLGPRHVHFRLENKWAN
jgi:hypothetical protein